MNRDELTIGYEKLCGSPGNANIKVDISSYRDFLLYGEMIWKCCPLIQIGQKVSLDERYSVGALMKLVVTATSVSDGLFL